jgi:hypothetical protein
MKPACQVAGPKNPKKNRPGKTPGKPEKEAPVKTGQGE